MALIGALGAKWVRADAPWGAGGTWPGIGHNLGVSPNYQTAAVTAIDLLAPQCAANGLDFLVPVDVGAGGGLFPTGSTPAGYAVMMACLVVPCPGLTWEIMNEPDYSGTTAALHTQLVQAAYPA